MGKTTGIPYARSTFNPWIGCTKISPKCDHCYAEAQDARKVFGGATHWGPRVPRLRTSDANWNDVRRWNRLAPKSESFGRKGFWPVFSASLADIFDNEVPPEWRRDFWALVRECRNLTFIIVTARIGNAPAMLPDDWGAGYTNVWMISSITKQAEADRDINKLLSVPAVLRGLSMEPLLEAVDLRRWLDPVSEVLGTLHHPPASLSWIISGGESKAKARHMDLAWPRALRDQCADVGVPFFMKQLSQADYPDTFGDFETFPTDMQVRQFPEIRP